MPKLGFHPSATDPKGSKPGSVLCPGKQQLFSGNVIFLRKRWSFAGTERGYEGS